MKKQEIKDYYFKGYTIQEYKGKFFVIGDNSDNGVFDTAKQAEQWVNNNKPLKGVK